MPISTYLFGTIVGIVLGSVTTALGAGGGVLIVPVLLLVFKRPLAEAAGIGLAMVGTAAIVGAIKHARYGNVRVQEGLLMGLACMAGAATGGYLQPYAPVEGLLLVLSGVLLYAAGLMLRGAPSKRKRAAKRTVYVPVIGFFVGALAGLAGVGGGFMIVPALNLLAGLPMKESIGTSTMVMAMTAASGFSVHFAAGRVPGTLAFCFAVGGALGGPLGARATNVLPEKPLRRIVGVAMLAAAASLLGRSL